MPKESPNIKPGQTGGKRERNRAERAKDLRDAGLALFLERGVESVSIADITEAGGTAKGNFYRYFKDKGDLLGAIMGPIAERLRSAFARCAETLIRVDTPEAAGQAYLFLGVTIASVLTDEPDACRLYLQEHRSAASPSTGPLRELADEIKARAVELSELAMKHGVVTIRDPQIGALAVMGASETLALVWLQGGLNTSPQDAVQGLVSLILDGIRPRE